MEEWKRDIACGYLVVRKPEYNFDEQGRGVYELTPPCLESIYYGGIDRMPWFELEESFYGNNLPERLKKYQRSIEENNRNLTGLLISQNFEEVDTILQFSNLEKQINEIIVIYSKTLSEIKGEIEVNSKDVNWLGYDVLSIGNWSLIREGIFRVPSAFENWLSNLNSNGLFSDIQIASIYIENYKEKMSGGIVEDFPQSLYGVDIFEIGRLKK